MANAVYDDEKEKQRHVGEADDLHALTGISPDEEKAMESAAYDGAADDILGREGVGKSLQSAEEKAGLPGASRAEQLEKALPAIAGQSLFNPTGDAGRLVGLITKKRAAGGGLAAAGVTGLIAMFGVAQGPLQVIHFAQLMTQFHHSNNEEFSNIRTARFIQNMRHGGLGTAVASSRLGSIGNKVADGFDAKFQRVSGLQPLYDERTGILRGYEVMDRNRSIDFLGDAGFDPDSDFEIIDRSEIAGTDAEQYGRRPDRTRPTGDIIDLRPGDTDFSRRRKFTRVAVKATHTNRVAGALASRLLQRRAGVDFSPDLIRRRVGENLVDYRRRVNRERAEKIRSGTDPDVRTAGADDTDANGDGQPDSANPELDDAARQGREAVDDIVGAEIDGPDVVRNIRSRLLTRIGGGAAAVVGILCTARELGRASEQLQYTQVVLPMIRMGMEVVTVGNRIMLGGEVSADQVGVMVNNFKDLEKQETWIEARSIQAELGHSTEGRPDIGENARISAVEARPAFFAAIDSIPGIGAACGVSSFIGGLPIIKQIGELTGSVISTVIPIDELVNGLVGWLAGDATNVFAQGAEYGNLVSHGNRAAANDDGIATGGIELPNSSVVELDAASRTEREFAMSKRSFKDRVFDVKNVNSVAGRTALAMPRTPKMAISMLARAPTNVFGVFSSRVSAQAPVEYDYGFPEFGFGLDVQMDPAYDNPFANAERIEPLLDSRPGRPGLNDTYGGPCFGIRVNPNGSGRIEQTGPDGSAAKKYHEIPRDVCNDNNTNFRAYRMYVADFIIGTSLACYERDAEACRNLDIGAGASSSTAAPSGTGAVGTDTSAQQCTVGTDAGLGSTPDVNKKIRLCNVDGVTVNVSIAQNVKTIIDRGAAAGYDFASGSGGYRSHEGQINARRNNCGTSQYDIYEKPSGQCSPPTAIPGRSLHEWGLAVDFHCNGPLISSRASGCFSWLADNQATHNLINLPSEPWHWSSTGS